MRLILTGLGILLIVALTAALAAPYFIDWNGQRAFLEARLSHALGQKVTIGGSIDVKLLPTPYLVLDQAVVGSDDGPIRIGIRHLDLELSVMPLLHGEFEVVDAKLEDPTIRVTLEPDRTLPALPTGPAFRADVRFDRVSVSDGTLAIADPTSGHTFVLDDLDFAADAPSLAGPFKIAGATGPSDARTKFRIATTTAQNGRALVHLVVAETPRHAALDLDGTLALTSAGRSAVRQGFEGTLVASGHLDRGPDTSVAWRLSGPLKADPARARLVGGELRIGSEDGGLRLVAAGEADLGATPSLHLDLTAKQLDIDRLAGAPVEADGKLDQPPTPTLPDDASLRHALIAATPPLPTALDVSIDTATWGGETLSDLALHLGLGASGPRRFQVGGDGPGGSHVGIDGMIDAGSTPRFAGTVEIAADNVHRTLGWLATVAPRFAIPSADMPFRRVSLAGKVQAGPRTIEATDLALMFDRSILTGTARLALGATPKVTAALQAKTLDLDGLPDLAELRTATAAIDLDLTLAARAIKVSRVGGGTLDAGSIDLSFVKSGDHAAVRRFHADDLGGASVNAMGTLDDAGATFDASIDATRLDAAAALVRQLAPGGVADALVARAPALAPARLTIAAAWATKGAALDPTRVRIAGTLGATAVTAAIAPGAAGTISVAASLKAPKGDALLRQLGVRALPLDGIGASQITLDASHGTLDAKGHADRPFDTKLAATFGATHAAIAGRFVLSASPSGSGTISLDSPDVSPLLRSVALAFPDMTGTIPADAKGGLALGAEGVSVSDVAGRVGGVAVGGRLRWHPDGADKPALVGALTVDRLRVADIAGLALGPPQPAAADAAWSKLAFGGGLVDPPRASIALEIGALEILPSIVAKAAHIDLDITPATVAMRNVAATLAGGTVSGNLALRRDGRQGAVEGKLALDRVALDLPTLKGRIGGTLDIAGSGPSALALVSSLAGTGIATLGNVVIPDADTAALPKVFAQVESDDIAVDQETVARALRETATSPLAAGTRRFALDLAGGALGFTPTDPPGPADQPVTTALSGSFDLRRLTIAETVRETLNALPKNWSGSPPAIAFKAEGAAGAPTRSIDVSAFIDAVATRALARESARIEAYEFDVRERAFFNQRLQSERRREQDRLKAEADARKAEAERKAKIEAAKDAARQEKVRAEQAAQEQAQRDAAAARARGPEPPTAPDPAPRADRFAPPARGSPSDPTAAGRY